MGLLLCKPGYQEDNGEQMATNANIFWAVVYKAKQTLFH